MLADRAVQWNPPKATVSTIWLTMTETTDTRVYRIIFLPWGERASSSTPEGERSIAVDRTQDPTVGHELKSSRRGVAYRSPPLALAMPPSQVALGLGLRANVSRS